MNALIGLSTIFAIGIVVLFITYLVAGIFNKKPLRREKVIQAVALSGVLFALGLTGVISSITTPDVVKETIISLSYGVMFSGFVSMVMIAGRYAISSGNPPTQPPAKRKMKRKRRIRLSELFFTEEKTSSKMLTIS